MNIQGFEDKYQDLIDTLFEMKSVTVDLIEKYLQPFDFIYLGSKEISFHCPCSRERMVNNLFTLSEKDRQSIFEEDSQIEIRCDYCNTLYNILKEEVIGNLQ